MKQTLVTNLTLVNFHVPHLDILLELLVDRWLGLLPPFGTVLQAVLKYWRPPPFLALCCLSQQGLQTSPVQVRQQGPISVVIGDQVQFPEKVLICRDF